MARWVRFEANEKIYNDFQKWLQNDDDLPFVAVFGDTVLVHLHGTIGGLENGWSAKDLREYLTTSLGFDESQPVTLASCYGGTFDKDAYSKYGFTVYDTKYPLFSFCTAEYFTVLIPENDSDYETFCRTSCEIEIAMNAEYKAALAMLGSREKISEGIDKVVAMYMEDKATKAAFFKYREQQL